MDIKRKKKLFWSRIPKLLIAQLRKTSLPVREYHPERIRWRGLEGQSLADCTYCNREITQEETDIELVSNTWGDLRARGKIWCKVCGARKVFSTVE